jgi:hypothetical protein
LFRKGLHGGTVWRFAASADQAKSEKVVSERFSQGAVAFHRAGGRWRQRSIPNQEWLPPPSVRRDPGNPVDTPDP